MLQPAPSSPSAPPTSDIRAQAVQTWVYGVIWLFVAVMVGVVLMMVARRWALASRAVSSRHNKRRRTDTSSVWEESGRRMDVPSVAEDEKGEEP